MATVTDNNIHIVDSYKIGKKGMRRILVDISNRYPNCAVFKNRKLSSLVNEWRVHNFLYLLGIAKSHTKDVDLNSPIKWYAELAYNVLGVLVYPFIN